MILLTVKGYEENKINCEPLQSIYKGQSFTNQDVLETMKKYTDSIVYEKSNDIEKEIVDKLIDYKIVGRFKGKEEFGARFTGA